MENKVILLASDQFGKGDISLGENVLETFFTLIKQIEKKPVAIFCMNRGVFALTEQSLASLHMAELQKSGVGIFACKTCVDYYGVEGMISTGQISSMAHFVELASQFEVITIS
jgi:intracellular sulfur oxidation DsrE/DsrF family protein